MKNFFTLILLIVIHFVGITQTNTFTSSGSFTVPAGVTSIMVEAWGSGGSGGGAIGNASGFRAMGGGGGGGAYSSGTIAVTPGQVINYIVAPQTAASTTSTVNGGSSSFSTIIALGGTGGQAVAATSTSNAGGTGGAGGTGTTSGGNGGSGVGYTGTTTNTQPGGGGGAGTTGNGGNGMDWSILAGQATGGIGGVSDGGAGANGRASSGNNGIIGSAPGGGGSGAYAAAGTTQRSGGAGARGEIRITYTPLPVKFSLLDVKNKENVNQISFSTLSEVNNDYFTIERSADGRAFDDIAKIAGAGNSSEELNYQYNDNTPANGVNYYRIRQTDYDGTAAYSEIKSVTVGGKDAFTVNPRSTYRSLDISTDAVDYEANLYNVSGQLVKTFTQLSANQTIDIEDMTSGLYYLHITHGGNVETFKVSKL